MGETQIRIRRCPHPKRMSRRWYEVEWIDRESRETVWHRETGTPASYLVPPMHVADVWPLINAADANWERGSSEWVNDWPAEA